MIGIYKITSPSGRVYIGQSVNIEQRWNDYKNKNCKSQGKLYNSFNKYGVYKHKFEIIEECNFEDLNKLERYYQELYSATCPKKGLNCVLVNTDTQKKVVSEETRLKMSESRKGKKHTKETRANISKGNKGKKLSQETRRRISETTKGKNHHSYTEVKAISPEGKVYINGITDLSKELNISKNTIKKILNGGYSKKWKDWTFEYVEKK